MLSQLELDYKSPNSLFIQRWLRCFEGLEASLEQQERDCS